MKDFGERLVHPVSLFGGFTNKEAPVQKPEVTVWTEYVPDRYVDGCYEQGARLIRRRTVTQADQANIDSLRRAVDDAKDGMSSLNWKNANDQLTAYLDSLTETYDVDRLLGLARYDSSYFLLAESLGLEPVK
ncbi:hypothetical protein KC960_02530 [Candidatus Saccharibacteria bacterium]|nr:hypothetical protein [Candidatus Saccharibacteria bacterium]